MSPRPTAPDRILETSLYVRDLDRARDFYRRVFDFPVLVTGDRLVALDVGGAQVLLLFLQGASSDASETDAGRLPGHDARGSSHLAFPIEAAALASWEEHLSEAGVDIEGRMSWPRGGTSIYFRDPDGHLLELVTPGVWATF